MLSVQMDETYFFLAAVVSFFASKSNACNVEDGRVDDSLGRINDSLSKPNMLGDRMRLIIDDETECTVYRLIMTSFKLRINM